MLLAAFVIPVTLAAAEMAAGVPNFHRVDDRLYRGAQPNAAGFQSLARLGIRTVIDLRDAGRRSQWEGNLVRAAGMRYVNIPLSGIEAPSPAKVREVLALFENASASPVFIHCRQGADRTGTLVACYRIEHDGWQNRKALQEAHSMGMHWFEFAMKNYILSFTVTTAANH
jgi:tyrosine-protein phosphatase SIW14